MDESRDLLGRPRVVVVTRPSEYQLLLAQHGTREQANFFLSTRGQTIAPIHAAHEAFAAARHEVLAAIPGSWRQACIERGDLHRFLFEPNDLVIAIGQDGLVANVAKYLRGQTVIGIDPLPGSNAGVLVRHRAGAAGKLMQAAARGRLQVERRTMVEVKLDDGQRLVALNEIYLGHPRHQSARYRIATQAGSERHSSSGVVVTTGTGATGWACSIARQRAPLSLPQPEEARLAFYVREAWPSPTTGTAITQGLLDAGERIELISEHDEGVVFGDGIEADRLEFRWGVRASVGVAETRLHLARG
jgi:NAD kinase